MSDMVDGESRRYEVVCKLAGGGMADLYLGRTLGPGGFERLVVIKRIAKRLASQPSAVQSLLDEARIAATLSHANIVQVTDIEIAGGQVSIVMEFLHGHDVAHLLRRMRKRGELVPLDQAIAIVLGVCAGLHHAHERVDSTGKSLDIVHRDVSPHNVFVTYDGAIKLVDFGIARASVRKGHTDHGFIKGKPGYIAPEQIRGRNTDRRTDVWGAAVLLYELTTGKTPYGSGTSFAELALVTKLDPPAPSTMLADYPPDLEAIVMCGLARDPDERFPTAEAMRAALEELARARGLDLSPFRMAALMEHVFAENLEAWRQSQRMGRSLAEHVAAFKTSGVHDMIDLPGDPTEPFEPHEPTTPYVPPDPTKTLVTADLLSVSLPTGPTRLVEMPRVEPRAELAPQLEPDPEPAYPSMRVPAPPRWRRALALALATPLVLLGSLLAWGALAPERSANVVEASPAQAERVDVPHVAAEPEPGAAPVEEMHVTAPAEPELAREAHATAVGDERVARPIVTPLEPEPVPAEPAETEPRVESAVAHASPVPARKRPAAKPAKRRAARSVRPRATPPPSPPQPAEDDLDALLPR